MRKRGEGSPIKRILSTSPRFSPRLYGVGGVRLFRLKLEENLIFPHPPFYLIIIHTFFNRLDVQNKKNNFLINLYSPRLYFPSKYKLTERIKKFVIEKIF